MGAEILSRNCWKIIGGVIRHNFVHFYERVPPGPGAMVRAVAYCASSSGSIPAHSIGFSILGVGVRILLGPFNG